MDKLVAQTKKAMGYVENPGTCGTCKFFREEENPHLDRDWILLCTFSNVVNFTTVKGATCSNYKRKR